MRAGEEWGGEVVWIVYRRGRMLARDSRYAVDVPLTAVAWCGRGGAGRAAVVQCRGWQRKRLASLGSRTCASSKLTNERRWSTLRQRSRRVSSPPGGRGVLNSRQREKVELSRVPRSVPASNYAIPSQRVLSGQFRAYAASAYNVSGWESVCPNDLLRPAVRNSRYSRSGPRRSPAALPLSARTATVPRWAGCLFRLLNALPPGDFLPRCCYELSRRIRRRAACLGSNHSSAHDSKRRLSSSRRAMFFKLPNSFPTGRPPASASRRSRLPRSNNCTRMKAICSKR